MIFLLGFKYFIMEKTKWNGICKYFQISYQSNRAYDRKNKIQCSSFRFFPMRKQKTELLTSMGSNRGIYIENHSENFSGFNQGFPRCSYTWLINKLGQIKDYGNVFEKKKKKIALKKLKKPPQKVAYLSRNSVVSEIFHLLPTYSPTAQMAEIMFQNVVYRATVYRTGP